MGYILKLQTVTFDANDEDQNTHLVGDFAFELQGERHNKGDSALKDQSRMLLDFKKYFST